MKLYLPPLNKATGALAQLVEQRTENPCVPGSIPGGTTKKSEQNCSDFLFFILFKLTT